MPLFQQPDSGKRYVPMLLIISSLLLLTAFLIFWLKKEYDAQLGMLRRETDRAFWHTVLVAQDTLFIKNLTRNERVASTPVTRRRIEPELPEEERDRVFIYRSWDSTLRVTPPGAPPHRSDTLNGSQRRVVLQRATRLLRFGLGQGTSEMIQRVLPDSLRDSLRLADLRKQYRSELRASGIRLNFEVFRAEKPNVRLTKGFSTRDVPAGLPPQHYHAEFEGYQTYILRQLAPQGAFSVFLLALTGLAFGLIYRNLRQQQRLMELKNDFIGNITHELKTPLATVGVAVEALRNFNALDDPARTREYLDIARGELARLGLLVDNVLQTALFERKSLTLNPEVLELETLTRQVLTTLQPRFAEQGAVVSFGSSGGPFRLRADALHLTSVLYNLLDNALKYSPGQPRIDIRLTRNDEEMRLAIRDQGPGIAREYQKKIFEKFFRIPTGNLHNVKGHGLGLSYAAKVVTGLGGHIEVESEVGKGSEFTVVFKNRLGVEPAL